MKKMAIHAQPILLTVPFIVCEDIKLEPNGILADIAPSILELMGISKPKLMDGKSLIV